jgi:hypothetical protein
MGLDSLLFVGESIQRNCPRPQRGSLVWRGHLFAITDHGDMYQRQLTTEQFLVLNESFTWMFLNSADDGEVEMTGALKAVVHNESNSILKQLQQ